MTHCINVKQRFGFNNQQEGSGIRDSERDRRRVYGLGSKGRTYFEGDGRGCSCEPLD